MDHALCRVGQFLSNGFRHRIVERRALGAPRFHTGKAAYSIPAYSDRPTGLESNTVEGSATSTDRNRLRRRAPTLTHVRQQAS